MLAAEDNARKEEENEALRHQLLQVQEQLQAVQAEPTPAASPQVCTHLADKAAPPLSICSKCLLAQSPGLCSLLAFVCNDVPGCEAAVLHDRDRH